jgi:23S rRNA pseudouridine2605 synthase
VAERLQRYLARAGVASRRHAETLITEGRVTVNNQLTTTLGTKVEPDDLVALDGKLVMPPEKVSWYVLYKPAGVVTTLDDPQGRPTVLGLLGEIPTRVFPIGRLDWDAEGALLLTDDGSAAHRLLHPSFQVPRTYLAKVKGVPTDEGLARLVSGVRLEDGPAKALEASRFQAVERNTWLRVTVGEGRPHLVKRLCAAIGHPVVRLFRPHQAGISVAGMQPGELRELRPEELAIIAAVAAGQAVPPMTLSLPPRRHGRADEDAEDGAADAPARPPKPPRFGTREWRHAAAGKAAPRGHAAEDKGAGSPVRATWRPRASLAPGRGPERRPAGPPRSFAPARGENGSRKGAAGSGALPDARRRAPSADAGFVRRGPPRGDAGRSGRPPRDRPEGSGDGRGRPERRPPGARPGFTGGKPAGRRGFGRREDGADARGRPEGRRGEPAPARRGPPGAASRFRGPGPSGLDKGPGRREGAGRDFRGKPAEAGRGARRGTFGPPDARRGNSPGRGPPPRGLPAGRPGGGRAAGARGGPGQRTRPPGGGRPAEGRTSRGRPGETRRGPPRPRGGPRSPRR